MGVVPRLPDHQHHEVPRHCCRRPGGRSCRQARGYTGYGGVYNGMAVEAEAMNAAKQASKMAVDIFNDESLDGIAATRGERKAVYVPTFFTNVPQAAAHPVAAAHAESNRFSRDAQQFQPQTFYREYSPSHPNIY